MKKLIYIGISIFIVAAMMSCSNTLNIAGPEIADSETSATGVLTITIPPVHPFLASRTRDADVMAYGIATSTYFELLDESMAVVDTQSVSADDTIVDWVVEAGSNYSVYAAVYNSYASGYPSPMVEGTSTTFDVLPGQNTSVYITALPFSPTALTDGVTTSTLSESQYGEKWFVFTASDIAAEVELNSVTGDLDLYIVGPDGIYMAESETTDTIETLTVATASGSDYYVLVYGVSGGTYQLTVNSTSTPVRSTTSWSACA